MNRVLVDTVAFLALLVSHDQAHQSATRVFKNLCAHRSMRLTTLYILVETYARSVAASCWTKLSAFATMSRRHTPFGLPSQPTRRAWRWILSMVLGECLQHPRRRRQWSGNRQCADGTGGPDVKHPNREHRTVFPVRRPGQLRLGRWCV